jgi:hypothetical protein
MADQRTSDGIADDYQAARDRGDAAAMRRYQNEETHSLANRYRGPAKGEYDILTYDVNIT